MFKCGLDNDTTVCYELCMASSIIVRSALRRLQASRKLVEKTVLKAIDAEARRCRLTEIQLLVWEDRFLRDGKPVTNAKIRKLLDLYIDEVHPAGITGIWTSKDGWAR